MEEAEQLEKLMIKGVITKNSRRGYFLKEKTDVQKHSEKCIPNVEEVNRVIDSIDERQSISEPDDPQNPCNSASLQQFSAKYTNDKSGSLGSVSKNSELTGDLRSSGKEKKRAHDEVTTHVSSSFIESQNQPIYKIAITLFRSDIILFIAFLG